MKEDTEKRLSMWMSRLSCVDRFVSINEGCGTVVRWLLLPWLQALRVRRGSFLIFTATIQ